MHKNILKYLFLLLFGIFIGVVITNFLYEKYEKEKAKATLLQGAFFLENKDYANAIACFSTSVAVMPEWCEPYYALGQVYEEIDQQEIALTWYNKAREVLNKFEQPTTVDTTYIRNEIKNKIIKLNENKRKYTSANNGLSLH